MKIIFAGDKILFRLRPRFGKTIKFKNPEKNLALWVGGFRVKFTSDTSGSLLLSEVLPVDGLQDRVDQGFEKVDYAQEQVDSWWTSLPPEEQANPVNRAKYSTANRAIDATTNLLVAVDGALGNAEDATVQYSLDKNLKDKWNFIVGSQLQLSRHWMLRAEFRFLGSRQQFIGGIQFRFGL